MTAIRTVVTKLRILGLTSLRTAAGRMPRIDSAKFDLAAAQEDRPSNQRVGVLFSARTA
jgi:hypothetical protein